MSSSLYVIEVERLAGGTTTLGEYAGKVLLIVNTASKCGLTPHYAGLEKLHQTYKDRGLVVLGFPCNQFGAQEPGSAEEIGAFCTKNYGVSFAMFAKIEVNGDDRHPLYAELTEVADADGEAGDIQWNFEKFLVSRDAGEVIRFRPGVEPLSDEVTSAIEANLPS